MKHTERKCDYCGVNYMADNRNLKRGWGLCCSKSCAAKKRERNKPGYNTKRVSTNNIKRSRWLSPNDRYPYSYDGADDDQWGDCGFGIQD